MEIDNYLSNIYILFDKLNNIDDLDPEFDTILNKLNKLLHIIPYDKDFYYSYLDYIIDDVLDLEIKHFRSLIKDALYKSNLLKADNILRAIIDKQHIIFSRDYWDQLDTNLKRDNLQSSLKWLEDNKNDLIRKV